MATKLSKNHAFLQIDSVNLLKLVAVRGILLLKECTHSVFPRLYKNSFIQISSQGVEIALDGAIAALIKTRTGKGWGKDYKARKWLSQVVRSHYSIVCSSVHCVSVCICVSMHACTLQDWTCRGIAPSLASILMNIHESSFAHTSLHSFCQSVATNLTICFPILSSWRKGDLFTRW